MARKALIVKTEKRHKAKTKAQAAGKKESFPTRAYNRCKVCGKPRGYIRKYEMCRICFREKANQGLIPGVKKSSW